MGVHAKIGADKFPKQGSLIDKRVNVCFNYDTERKFPGICIRDDVEEPFLTIFHLDDGRAVLATECQYQSAASQAQAIAPDVQAECRPVVAVLSLQSAEAGRGETPRTDAAIIKMSPTFSCVSVEFARQLERELHEMTESSARNYALFEQAQNRASVPPSAAFASDYESKIQRDAETVKAMRKKLVELCDRLAWKGPSREENLEITVREARALVQAHDRIVGGVAFIMGPDAASSVPSAIGGITEDSVAKFFGIDRDYTRPDTWTWPFHSVRYDNLFDAVRAKLALSDRGSDG